MEKNSIKIQKESHSDLPLEREKLSRVYTHPSLLRIFADSLLGWDIGLEGIQLGGERKILIPSAMAYGSKGIAPDIPANSDLSFEVKCVDLRS